MKVTDIAEVVKLANQGDILTIADNTFLTPYYQRPLLLGVEISVHSAA